MEPTGGVGGEDRAVSWEEERSNGQLWQYNRYNGSNGECAVRAVGKKHGGRWTTGKRNGKGAGVWEGGDGCGSGR